MKVLKNQKGITLVEMLGVLVIGSIISILAFNILFSMLKNEDKVAVNAQLRDEADYYIESLTNMLYTLNESRVCVKPDNSILQTNDGQSYILLDSCTKTETGFVRNDGSLSIYVEGKKINGTNSEITIDDSSFMEKEGNIYKISLTLSYNKNLKTFKSEVHSIPN